MLNPGKYPVAHFGELRVPNANPAESSKVALASSDRTASLLENVSEDSEMANRSEFFSILKHVYRDALECRYDFSAAVFESLIQVLDELRNRNNPVFRLPASDNVRFMLEYRFHDYGNLLEVLLGSGYRDLSDVAKENTENLRALMLRIGVGVPNAEESAKLRFRGLSKGFVHIDGSTNVSLRNEMEDFIRRVSEQKNVNVRLRWGETMFQILLAQLADPGNSEKAHKCLVILTHEIASNEQLWTSCVDPDTRDSNGKNTEQILMEKGFELRNDPDGFPEELLVRKYKLTQYWLDFARKAKLLAQSGAR